MIPIIQHIASQLQAVYPPDEAVALAWWVAEETTGFTRTELQFGGKGTTFSPHMQKIIARLLNFEPIQYISGHTEWLGLDLLVTPATLIPRPETAELAETVSNCFKLIPAPSDLRVLDIGTGCGCIALALKKKHPEWQVTGMDISAEAIEVARQNAKRNGVEAVFVEADIFADSFAFSDTYDVVVSNPPYIRECEKPSMRPNVLDYEPHTALFVPDDDPLRFYRRIAALYARCKPEAGEQPAQRYLFFEINEAYPDELSRMLGGMGYTDIRLTHDIYGKPRILQGRMAG